jgi:hypothetical protein
LKGRRKAGLFHRAFAHEFWPTLLTDGLRRAAQTRAKDRIARIAIILSNSLVEETAPAADHVEEMMRIAMDLADRDVLALKLIADSASGSLWSDRLGLYQALDLFKRVPFRAYGFSDSDVASTYGKLASFGLLARLDLPSNQNVMTNMHNAMSFCRRERHPFVSSIQRRDRIEISGVLQSDPVRPYRIWERIRIKQRRSCV